MFAVSDYLDRHSRNKVNALDRPLMFVFPDIMDACHSVVEMGRMSAAAFEGFENLGIFRFGMGQRRQDRMLPETFGKGFCARKFWGEIPPFDDFCANILENLLQDMEIILVLRELLNSL